ncbi:PHP domain-containing protein [Calditrichota bacterium]
MGLIDLHSHSTASDGSHTPTELVKDAAQLGVTTLALSDHDTVAGIDEAFTAGSVHGIEIIPAVEISVDTPGDDMHLLGYGIDHHNTELVDVLNKLVDGRHTRNKEIVSKLNELGLAISYDDVLAISKEGVPGRAHIAEALWQKGLIAEFNDAFEKYLKRGKPAHADRFRYQIADAIALIHRAGGIAVWAHPGLHRDRLEEMLGYLPEWVDAGLDGIESDYFNHSLELRDRIRGIAVEHGLIYTGGSDFHGLIKYENTLGVGAGGKPVDQKCLEMLKERLSDNNV